MSNSTNSTVLKKTLSVLVCLTLIFGSLFTFNTRSYAATTAKYHYKTYDKSKTYKGKYTVKDNEKYKRVILDGKSDAVKKINKQLKKICDSELKRMNGEYAKGASKNGFGNVTFYNVHTSKVTYNQNNIISIRVTYTWYQGGVNDYGTNGYTFDLKTGKRLKLTNVCNSSRSKLTKEIKQKIIKKYGNEPFSGSFEDNFNKINASKVDFYLKKGNKAIVVFDKYEISYGAAGAFEVSVKSKYK